MIGFLSPEGKFYECSSWEHGYKAKELCDSLNIEYQNSVDAETNLLDIGYICFRARDIYCNHAKHWVTPIISDKAINFVKDNIESMENSDKKESALSMLKLLGCETDSLREKILSNKGVR